MFSTLLAQTAAPEQGFDIFSLLLPLALGALIFMMFRRQKKTQKTIKEQRTQMVPGTEVMTNFGLFGTVISLDEENNKAVLELGPGAQATVHMQTLTKVVQPEPAADDEETPAVPDDASSLTSPIADTSATGSRTTAVDGQDQPNHDAVLPESGTERLDARSDDDIRLDYDNKRDNKDN